MSNLTRDQCQLFFSRSCILSVFFLLAGYLIFRRWEPEWYTPLLIYCLVFVWIVTNTTYALLRGTYLKNPRQFNPLFLASVFIKMFASLIFILVVVWRAREYAAVLLLSFLVIYLVFTIFEIREILRLVKEKK